jgi:hypothetical protein
LRSSARWAWWRAPTSSRTSSWTASTCAACAAARIRRSAPRCAPSAFAFIDLPRGRLHPAFGATHRLYDLACLYREFRHALARDEWRAFLARYQQAFGAPDEAEVERALRVTERLTLQMAHLTPSRRRYRQLKKRFKRTPLGEFLTGHRYERSA